MDEVDCLWDGHDAKIQWWTEGAVRSYLEFPNNLVDDQFFFFGIHYQYSLTGSIMIEIDLSPQKMEGFDHRLVIYVMKMGVTKSFSDLLRQQIPGFQEFLGGSSRELQVVTTFVKEKTPRNTNQLPLFVSWSFKSSHDLYI